MTKIGRSMVTSACCGYCFHAASDTSRATSALRTKNRFILLPSSVRSASRWNDSSSTPEGFAVVVVVDTEIVEPAGLDGRGVQVLDGADIGSSELIRPCIPRN